MPHYYDADPGGSGAPFRITIAGRGKTCELWSAPGVFSKEHLDAASALLIDTCVLQRGARVHDLGCGYGAIGILAKLAEPSCHVLCSDVSGTAIELTNKNARELQLPIRVVQADAYEGIDEMFDTVLLNPPYVAGRETVFRLIDSAHAHLVSGGLLQVVARHAKGGETIKRKLVELFHNCDDSRRRGGFRIYVARKD